MDDSQGRLLNVSLLAGSEAYRAYYREVDLADGSGAVPVQLMWSNKAEAPAPRVA